MWVTSPPESALLERVQPLKLTASTILLAAASLVTFVAIVLLALNLISVLVTVFLAIILAETIRPLVVALQRRGVPRSLAILAIYLGLAGALAGSLALILPPLWQQLIELAREAPGYVQTLRQMLPALNQALIEVGVLGELQVALRDVAAQAPLVVRTLGSALVQGFAGIVSILSGFVLAAFWIGLTEAVNRDLVSALPTERRVLIRTVAADLSVTLGGWLRGQLILMLFVGVLSFVGLFLLGVRYPVPLAVWAGMTEIVPMIGPWIGGVPAVIIGGADNLPRGAGVFLLYLGIQWVENSFLVPKVMQRAVGLHPFVVLVALLIGGSLLGLTGIIISVPLAASIQVLLARLWFPSLAAPATAPPIEKVLAELPVDAPSGPAEDPSRASEAGRGARRGGGFGR